MTPASAYIGAAAEAADGQAGPRTAAILSFSTWRLATLVARPGSHRSSSTISPTGIPSTPPAALSSCTATSAELTACRPRTAWDPLVGAEMAIGTFPDEQSGGQNSAACAELTSQ